LIRFFAIGLPTTPSPMKPTISVIALLVLLSACYREARAFRRAGTISLG
jgi:hypothetical protein